MNLHKHTGQFASDNEPDGIENATHNTVAKQTTWIWTPTRSRLTLQLFTFYKMTTYIFLTDSDKLFSLSSDVKSHKKIQNLENSLNS
jgi:hypothetical protein